MRTYNLHTRKPTYLRHKRLKRGDTSADGKVFWSYTQGAEAWVTPERFAEACEEIRVEGKAKLLTK